MQFGTPGTAGGLTLIKGGNLATGSPTFVDITNIPQIYRGLTIFVNGASNSVATRALRVQVAAGGDTVGTANCTAQYTQINDTTPAATQSQTSLWTGVTQTAAQISSCTINIPAYQNGPIKQYMGRACLAQPSGVPWNYTTNCIFVHGVLSQTGATGVEETRAITGVRITWDNVATGVFDAGTYALYGWN